MHSSYGHIPSFMLISIFWISQRDELVVVKASWCQCPGTLVWFFSRKTPVPSKEMKTVISLTCCLALFFSPSTSVIPFRTKWMDLPLQNNVFSYALCITWSMNPSILVHEQLYCAEVHLFQPSNHRGQRESPPEQLLYFKGVWRNE